MGPRGCGTNGSWEQCTVGPIGNKTKWLWDPGGMSHWGLYIILVNHFLKSTLNKDEATKPTALCTRQHACAPGYRSQISYPFRGSSADLSGGSVNLIPFFGSMTYAPTTNAPARNANVEAYINPDPNPNPNPNPNPYPALNQKPNHTHESNSVFGEVSMPEQLSPEHKIMLCHPFFIFSCFQYP